MSRNRKLVILVLTFYALLSNGCRRLDWEGAELLKSPDAIRIESPEWSPDGSSIAFLTWDNVHAEGDIFVYTLETNTYRTLVTDTYATEVQWSPNGKLLLVTEGDGLKLIRTEDSQILTTIDGFAGGWSPDGYLYSLADNEISYRIDLSRSEHPFSNVQLIIGELERSVGFGAYQGISLNEKYLVSSFGTGHIIQEFVEENDIYVFDLEGQLWYSLGSDTTDDIDPSIFPHNDGWLIYLERSNIEKIVFTNFAETCTYRQQITEGQITGISVSPDGNRLAISVLDQLYIIDFEDVFGNTADDLISRCEGDPTN